MQWLKHAFGIEPASSLSPTPAQIKVIDQFCEIVVRKKLTVPVNLFLETVRPLNYVGSQVLHGLSPFVAAFMNPDSFNQLAQFLEHRGAIDFLCERIKQTEEEALKINSENESENAPDSLSSPDQASSEQEVRS